jgi:ligand-binding SRPBCC domain-containing protein
MEDQVFTTEQLVPMPREGVFDFFSEPGNLEAITPPWLRFRIVDRSTEKVEKGSELTAARTVELLRGVEGDTP